MSTTFFLPTEEAAAIMTRSASAFHGTGRISYSAERISAPNTTTTTTTTTTTSSLLAISCVVAGLFNISLTVKEFFSCSICV
jgi:uncharacterized membrane protein YiaA